MAASAMSLLLNVSTAQKVIIPDNWCQRNISTTCICEYSDNEVDVNVIDYLISSNNTLTDPHDELANLVDWWMEGVALPVICAIGIIGKDMVYTYFLEGENVLG